MSVASTILLADAKLVVQVGDSPLSRLAPYGSKRGMPEHCHVHDKNTEVSRRLCCVTSCEADEVYVGREGREKEPLKV